MTLHSNDNNDDDDDDDVHDDKKSTFRGSLSQLLAFSRRDFPLFSFSS